MRAWLMDSYEGTEKLRLGEVQDPEPGPGQVLLRVKLAALNPADAFLAQAMYPARPPLPHILGRYGVGDVIAVGSGVDNSLLGRTVGFLRSSVGVEAIRAISARTYGKGACASSRLGDQSIRMREEMPRVACRQQLCRPVK